MPRRLDYPERVIRDVLIELNNGMSVDMIAAKLQYPHRRALASALRGFGRPDLARRFGGGGTS